MSAQPSHPADVRSVEQLLNSSSFDSAPSYLFFCQHSPATQGVIDQSCFSQWYPAPFELDGHRFSTAEHYMMFRKAVLFRDARAAKEIVGAPSPKRAKQLGRGVRGFTHNKWSKHRFDIVVAGSIAKFDQNADLRAYLVGSWPSVLVEASPSDKIWGIGLSAQDSAAADPNMWQGSNLLGFALMEARAALSKNAG